MKVYHKVADIQKYISYSRKEGKSIGFVPTMGALHEGHLSLLRACNTHSDISVVSIFVNPTQFNDKNDLEKYPKTIENDLLALLNEQCAVLFYPDVEEIYPSGTQLQQTYDLGVLETLFEGHYRPGHFQGVCQVVDRLFSIIHPNKVFFGQKDYQQCMVIKKLIALQPAFSNIEMHIVPTVREQSGLAMSSRNLRLSEDEKALATTIYQSLLFIKQSIKPGGTDILTSRAKEQLEQKGFKVDYVAVAHAITLEPVHHWDGKIPLVALIAAYLGNVRLIDNMILS
jgi:pantoate--beta-alanine ligase